MIDLNFWLGTYMQYILNGFGSVRNFEKSILYCISGKYKILKIFSGNFIKIRALFTEIYGFKRSNLNRI